MTFRATNQVTSDAYIGIKRTASALKTNCDNYISRLSTSGADYGLIGTIYLTLVDADTNIDTLKVTPGLEAYAQEQEDDPTYNFVAETQAMLAEVTDAFTWIETNIPVTDRTLKPITDWAAGETIVADTFTSGQTAGLQTLLQSVSDSIV